MRRRRASVRVLAKELNECGPSGICAFLNEARNSNMCTTLCDARPDGSCGDTPEACVPIAGLIDGARTGDAGTCLPCDYFEGFTECSLLLTGACDDDVDCAPLASELAGLDFTCHLATGRCVLQD